MPRNLSCHERAQSAGACSTTADGIVPGPGDLFEHGQSVGRSSCRCAESIETGDRRGAGCGDSIHPESSGTSRASGDASRSDRSGGGAGIPSLERCRDGPPLVGVPLVGVQCAGLERFQRPTGDRDRPERSMANASPAIIGWATTIAICSLDWWVVWERPLGEIGRHARLRILCRKASGFDSPSGHYLFEGDDGCVTK